MPRILHIADRLSAYGGADRHMLGMLERLQGRAETLLAVGRDDGSLPAEERAVIGPYTRCKGLDRQGMSARGGQAAARRLREVIDAFSPEVIHAHNVVDPLLIEAAAAAAPCLVMVQDHRWFCPGLGMLTRRGAPCRRPLGPHCRACFGDPAYYDALSALTGRRLEALGRAAGVVVLSAYMAEMLAKVGYPAGRIAILPPFVHRIAARPRRRAGAYHLLACRLVRRKGVAVALRAARALGPRMPLVVAGSGAMEKEVAAEAGRSGGRVRFVGWAQRESMARLLAEARSLWLPSLWAEPFGIVGLEALHLGTPVIAADVGGVAEWLDHGRSGIIVPPGDDEALGRAADRLADDELATKMGAHGRAAVSARFDADRLMDRLMGLYAAAKESSALRA